MNLQFKTKFPVQLPVKKGLTKFIKNSFKFFSEVLKIEDMTLRAGQAHREFVRQ